MTCIQATGLCTNLPIRPLSKRRPSSPFQTFFRPTKTHNQKLCVSLKRPPLCLMGGKDRAEDEVIGNLLAVLKQTESLQTILLSMKKTPEDFHAAWKSFGKAMEKFSKGQSIEDILRQQMENKDYHVGGNGGKNPPRGGGGGGGRDGSGGSSEDEGVMNETMQVILATIGFIFLYIYIIRGEELTRLGKDYIRYLYGGHKSIRLKNAMYSWKQFGEKVMYDKNWLEKLIINTQTWYNSPNKFSQISQGIKK